MVSGPADPKTIRIGEFRDAEKIRMPETVRINIDDAGCLNGHGGSAQTKLVSQALRAVVQVFLPRVRYTGEDSAFPEQPGQHNTNRLGIVIATFAMQAFLKDDKYNKGFEDFAKRWWEDSEFRRIIAEYVSPFD